MSEQPPPWGPYGQQDPWQPQGQPQHRPQQPYGQQPYPHAQLQYGQQQDLGQYQSQLPYLVQPYPRQDAQPSYQEPPFQGQPHQGQPQHLPQQTYPLGQPPYNPQGAYPLPGQPPYGPQHGRPPRRKSWPARHKVLTGLGAFVVLIILGSVANAASGGNHSSVPVAAASAATSATASTSAAAPADTQSAPAAPNCRNQIESWADNGGSGQIQALSADLTSIQTASYSLVSAINTGSDTSASEAALQSAAASLQSDAQTAQGNLPPTCVPHLRRDYSSALNDYSKAAINCENAVSELGSGSDAVATSDMETADAALSAGNGKLSTATADVKAFSNS